MAFEVAPFDYPVHDRQVPLSMRPINVTDKTIVAILKALINKYFP
jgi:hypothetical protein